MLISVCQYLNSVSQQITPGEYWRDEIAKAIDRSDAVVFVVSPTSVKSKYCKEELVYGTYTSINLLSRQLSSFVINSIPR
jgi:hypothetical protein